MKNVVIRDTYILLIAPVLAALTYYFGAGEVTDFPTIFILLLAVGISIVSLFIIPRYVGRGLAAKDVPKTLFALVVALLAAAPAVIAAATWVDYAEYWHLF